MTNIKRIMTTILNNDIAKPLYMLVYVKVNDTQNDYFFQFGISPSSYFQKTLIINVTYKSIHSLYSDFEKFFFPCFEKVDAVGLSEKLKSSDILITH